MLSIIWKRANETEPSMARVDRWVPVSGSTENNYHTKLFLPPVTESHTLMRDAYESTLILNISPSEFLKEWQNAHTRGAPFLDVDKFVDRAQGSNRFWEIMCS